MKKIPYGIADYQDIRQKDCYYVDKTVFIPKLEVAGDYLFFIRPRRFGKSLLLAVLEGYYDLNRIEEFEMLFKGTAIYDQPTSEKNKYLILTFNFSRVQPDIDKIEESFNMHVNKCFFFFGKKYHHLLGDDYFKMMETLSTAHQKLEFALDYVGAMGHKVYILIDEYDNFTNTILATIGQAAYHQVTHGTGFFRSFFNILKGAAGTFGSGVGRIFITGVSPVTMDDVTSGFNIGKNVSLYAEFNELLGFTKPEVTELLQYYNIPLDKTLLLMQEWYDNYRFCDQAESTMFNSDMVLYFVGHYLRLNGPPDNMIDDNIRIDYGKLRHLLVLDRKLNGNFSHLANIIKIRRMGPAKIVSSFPVERLTKPSNFTSLLFYFGLLSYAPTGELQIPNETVRQLMYSYLRDGYEDVNVFNVDIWLLATLIQKMAYQGEWRPVIEFLANEIQKQTAIRDYLTGEKVIQTFLLAYLSVTDYYIIRTEEEMGKGFVDLYIEPFWAKYAQVKFAYLIELKYITRSEFSETLLQKNLKEAKTQLQQYATDVQVVKRTQGATLKSVAMVYSGWELVACEEV